MKMKTEKYILKLKKRLPMVDDEVEVRLTGSPGCVPMCIFNHTVDISQEYLPQLLAEGWVEFVKEELE